MLRVDDSSGVVSAHFILPYLQAVSVDDSVGVVSAHFLPNTFEPYLPYLRADDLAGVSQC